MSNGIQAIRRTVLGEKHILETLKSEGEFYFIPRKFSNLAWDEIRQISLNHAQQLADSGVTEIIAKARQEHPEMSERDLINTLSEVDQLNVASALTKASSDTASVNKIYLLKGIASHNLTEDGSESTNVDEAFVDMVLDNMDLVKEMLEEINKVNPFDSSQSGKKK